VNIRLWSDSQCLKQYLEQVDEEGLASVAEVDRLQRKHSSYTPTSGLAQHPSSAASMPASSAALRPSSPLAPLGASFLVPAKPIIFHPNVTMKCKKIPTLHMNRSMFSIAYTKVLKSNPNSTVTLTPNLTESFSTLRFFFWDTSVYKHRTWQIVRNLLNFLPWPTRMISWDLDKSHDFQTSFAIFRI
jgi:hypothetical protein